MRESIAGRSRWSQSQWMRTVNSAPPPGVLATEFVPPCAGGKESSLPGFAGTPVMTEPQKIYVEIAERYERNGSGNVRIQGMGHARALPRGPARGPGSRTWRITFVIALIALSASATLLTLTVFRMLEAPAKAVTTSVDPLPSLPLDSLPLQMQEQLTPADVIEGSNPADPAVTTTGTRTTAEAPARERVYVPPANVPSRIASDAIERTIQQAVEATVAHHGGGISVVVIRLDDGKMAAVGGDVSWYAASLFKLAVLYEVERQIDAGIIARDERVYLTEADYAQDLGTSDWLPSADDGSLSVAEALEAMVTVSDNTTAVALMHLAGTANVDATLVELGLTATRVNTEDLPTTAADMALLMEAIATGRGLSDEAANDARGLLLRQRTRSGIPAGLPEGVTVGNKTGTWPGDTHDVAFVVTPKSIYIVAILTDRDWGWDTVAEVSAAIYEALTAPQ